MPNPHEPMTVPSVTTITANGYPKPGLKSWGEGIVADAGVEGIRTGTVDGESVAEMDDEALKKWLKSAANRSRDSAANLGTAVHDYIEALNRQEPRPEAPLRVKSYIDQFGAFLEVVGFDVEYAECKVYSRRHQYAGTLDMLGAAPSLGRAIVDVKSGRSTPTFPDNALQQVAYARADFLVADPHHPDSLRKDGKRGGGGRSYWWDGPAADEIPLGQIDAAYILHLRPDAWALFPVDIGEETFETFLNVKALAGWIRGDGKGAIPDEPAVSS